MFPRSLALRREQETKPPSHPSMNPRQSVSTRHAQTRCSLVRNYLWLLGCGIPSSRFPRGGHGLILTWAAYQRQQWHSVWNQSNPSQEPMDQRRRQPCTSFILPTPWRSVHVHDHGNINKQPPNKWCTVQDGGWHAHQTLQTDVFSPRPPVVHRSSVTVRDPKTWLKSQVL
jgi:hypothetical protein